MSNYLNPRKIIFYDLETNGLSSSLDRILEVYLAKYDFEKRGKKVKEFHSLIKIDNNHVDRYAFKKNGWTDEFLNTNGRPMADVMTDTYKILNEDEDSFLCGYVIRSFDNHFLKKMERRYEFTPFDFDNRTFDLALEYSAVLAGLYDRYPKEQWRTVHKMVLGNDYSHYIKGAGYGLKIEDCCAYYGIPVDNSQQHNARYDTMLNIEILKKQRPDWFKPTKNEITTK